MPEATSSANELAPTAAQAAAASTGPLVDMASRLQGATADELKADAAKLSALLAAPATGGNRTDQGQRSAGGRSTDWLRDNLARAH